MAKCRFGNTHKVLVWRNGKQVEVDRPVNRPHMHEKICDECRQAGLTKADDKRLRIAKGAK